MVTFSHSCFYHLVLLLPLQYVLSSIISQAKLETVIHAFVFSRLDYFNSLFTCLNKASLEHLNICTEHCCQTSDQTTKVLSRHTATRPAPKYALRSWFSLIGLWMVKHQHTSNNFYTCMSSRSLRSCDQSLQVVPCTRLKTESDRAQKQHLDSGRFSPLVWVCRLCWAG